MPNEPVARPQRDYCGLCGLPVSGVSGSRCEACGAPFEARPRLVMDDSAPRARQRARTNTLPETDPSGLERAFDAFRARDFARFVELVLMSEPAAQARSLPAPEGAAWVAAIRGALVFASLGQDDVVLEAPVARLPARSRLPALRLALELCAQEVAAARVGLRGELLILRLEGRVASFTPLLLRFHLREIGHLAARFGGLLVATCDALPPVPEDARTAIGFDLIGRARKLHLDGPGGGDEDGPRDSIPAILAPMFSSPRSGDSGVGSARAVPSPRPVGAAAASPMGHVGPPTVAQLFAAASGPSPFGSSASFDDPRRKPTVPVLEAISASDAGTAAGAGMAAGAGTAAGAYVAAGAGTAAGAYVAAGAGMAAGADMASPAGDGRPRARSIIELDGFAARAPTSQPSFDGGVVGNAAAALLASTVTSPAERLAMLVGDAKALALPTLEARPATVTWIIRALVFRVVYEFRDSVPDAASLLYHGTGVGRAGPPPSRSAELAAIEPALALFDAVIAARGHVARGEPIQIEPLTTAALAKEHVGRYLVEIDRAPGDAPLRHHIALGALAELLVRTKLPAHTGQRLRDIVAHANREGPKQAAIDLLMTALRRINA